MCTTSSNFVIIPFTSSSYTFARIGALLHGRHCLYNHCTLHAVLSFSSAGRLSLSEMIFREISVWSIMPYIVLPATCTARERGPHVSFSTSVEIQSLPSQEHIWLFGIMYTVVPQAAFFCEQNISFWSVVCGTNPGYRPSALDGSVVCWPCTQAVRVIIDKVQ